MSDNPHFAYDVFMSHSSKDKAIVRDGAGRLKNDGLRVWFDEWEIKPGDNIPAKIEEGLEQSRVLVLCMSTHAFGPDWAQLESSTFRFRDPLNKALRFIPLRLDDAPIKGSLAQFLFINWLKDAREQEYPKLLNACRPPTILTTAEAEAERAQFEKKILSLGHTSAIHSVAFSPDGRRALSGSSDNTVRLWDVEGGRCLSVFEGHTDSVLSVAWSGDGSRALSGSSDNTVRLWDVEGGRCLRVFGGHTDSVWSVAWSGDGRRVLSGSYDNTVRLWDVEGGRCLRVFEGHTDRVWSVAWSGDGRRALSGSDDKTVRLWDVEGGRCLSVFEGHTDRVWSVALGGDGRYACSVAVNGVMRVWEVDIPIAELRHEDKDGGMFNIPMPRCFLLVRVVRARRGFPWFWQVRNGNPAIQRSARGRRSGNCPWTQAMALNGRYSSGILADSLTNGLSTN